MTAKTKMSRSRTNVPLESTEQYHLFKWAGLAEKRWPQLCLLFAIPNGGWRNTVEAVNLVRQGVKKGVPDICLAYPNKTHHGLYIELKRKTGSRISPEQKVWVHNLTKAGYLAVVCKGYEEARKVIEDYLEDKI